MSSYDVSTYFLDKENIRDTVLRMMFGFDDRATSTLIDQVYTPEILVYYDPHLLDFHKRMPSEEWAKRLETMHDRYDTTQHIIQNLLIELPQPGRTTTQRPDRCKARAYAHGLFYNRDDEGRPCVMARRQGVSLQNMTHSFRPISCVQPHDILQGEYELELRRLPEMEEKGENPWRISELKVSLDWQDRGN